LALLVIRPGKGERSGGGPIQIRIIEDGSHTDARLGLVEATVPPGPALPTHVHRAHDEVFIVTAGALRFRSGEESVDVEAGSVVVIPPGVPHTFSNPFDVPAVFLNTFTPGHYVQYFRDLATLPLDGHGMLAPADIGQTMAHYVTEVVR